MAERNNNATAGTATTSTNIKNRQQGKKSAQVDSVLIKNDGTRKEMLKRVYWKDKQYTDFGGGDYVRDVEVSTVDVKPSTNGKELMDYTLDGKNEYSKEILKKYFSNDVEHRVYEDKPIADGERWKWDGDYRDEHIWDSKIFQVAQIKLPEGEIINRQHNDDRFLEQKYLTPALLNFYGDKVSAQLGIMQYTLRNHFDGIINVGTGRMADIPEANVKIEHDIQKAIDKGKDEVIGKYLAESIETAKKENQNYKTPAEEYVHFVSSDTISEDEDALNYYNNVPRGRGIIDNEREFSYNTTEFQFDEGDKPGYVRTKKTTSSPFGNNADWWLHGAQADNLLQLALSSNSTNEEEENLDNYEFSTISTKPKSLLYKTNELFKNHKIATLVGRFHTTFSDNGVDQKPSITDTAISKYGNSHGRNLLTKSAQNGATGKDINGYDDPYCRVWTYHHQYSHVEDLIRHGNDERKQLPYGDAKYPSGEGLDGRKYLKNNTVLGSNGFVNIAPKAADSCKTGSTRVDIKKCMFSIENLAWKDVPRVDEDGFTYLSEEQRGPNGGRIMWFPPYDLDFQENVSVNWNQSNFIGRGEPVFTYSNTNRTGTLSFAVLVDHPSIIDNIPKNNAKENSDNLTEDDILRFFAGCSTDDMNFESECPPQPTPDNNSSNDDEPVVAPNQDNCKHLRFYVYFPNNYSGYAFKNGVTASNYTANGPTDPLWFDYLLMGKNNTIPTDNLFNEQIGYEVSDAGISTNAAVASDWSGKTEDISKVYGTSTPWEEGHGTVKEGEWYTYRVDFDSHQFLENIDENGKSRGMQYDKTNYADTKSYKLNLLTGVTDDSGNPIREDANLSFAEVMQTFASFNSEILDDEKMFYENFNHYEIGVNEELMNLLRGLNGNSGTHTRTILKIEVIGYATAQDPENSPKLANRRAQAVKSLLTKYFPNENNLYLVHSGKTEGNGTGVNNLAEKLVRSVLVDIAYDGPSISQPTAILTETPTELEVDGGPGSSLQPTAVETTERVFINEGRTVANAMSSASTSPAVATDAAAVEATEVNISRYEDEAMYFKEIDKTDPLLFKNLIAKFKYFNPAFHSISPEGFNARLTFLQQCTRQGHTIEASNVNGFAKTAGNLSFGRMPVCVLRLGDFLNTKILVNGISFSYGASGPMQWDLNPEGIGVQPMYAKISMQITILGGQSLAGPINRLQNAVTFNYYANTGVYDNRSDRVRVGDGTYSKSAGEDGSLVRVGPKETNGERYGVYDESEYFKPDVQYENIFVPYPKTNKYEIEEDSNGTWKKKKNN